jgi:hypothetical protein
MIQQMVAVLDGLEKSELGATGWAGDVGSYRAEVIGHLAVRGPFEVRWLAGLGAADEGPSPPQGTAFPDSTGLRARWW